MNPYSIYIRPRALQEIKNLPGHMRQRVKRAINGFSEQPRPLGSIELSDIVLSREYTQAYRLKMEKWRIIYAIDEAEKAVDVLAVRQRPPYDYGDLGELIQEIL
jgi:mRNA interferase RelE/StbE